MEQGPGRPKHFRSTKDVQSNKTVKIIYSLLYQNTPGDGASCAEIGQFIQKMYSTKDVLSCGSFHVWPKGQPPLRNPTLHELRFVPLDKLRGQYFTFIRADSDVAHPIYVTIKPAERAARFAAITKMRWNQPGLVACRVTAPGQERAGKLVITVRTRREQDNLGELIGTDCDRNKHAYDQRAPRLTQPVRRMSGVSVGIQPPQMQIVGANGKLYAKNKKD